MHLLKFPFTSNTLRLSHFILLNLGAIPFSCTVDIYLLSLGYIFTNLLLIDNILFGVKITLVPIIQK